MTRSEPVLSHGGGLSGSELERLVARAREQRTLTRADLEECIRSTAVTPEIVESLRRLLALDGIELDPSADDPPISFLREIEAEVDAAEALAYETDHDEAEHRGDAVPAPPGSPGSHRCRDRLRRR